MPKVLKPKDSNVFNLYMEVRKRIQSKIHNFKSDEMTRLLRIALRELTPETETQRMLLPVLQIELSDGTTFNYRHTVNKGILRCKPRDLVYRSNFQIKNQIIKLASIRQSLATEDVHRNQSNPMIQGVLDALQDEIEGTTKSISDD